MKATNSRAFALLLQVVCSNTVTMLATNTNAEATAPAPLTSFSETGAACGRNDAHSSDSSRPSKSSYLHVARFSSPTEPGPAP